MVIDPAGRVQERFVTTAEAAAFLGKPISWLHNNAERYGLPFYVVGRQWRWRLSELSDWTQQQRAA